MDIRKISQENIYKLFIQLQIGKYAYIPISNMHAYKHMHTFMCIYILFVCFSGDGFDWRQVGITQ